MDLKKGGLITTFHKEFRDGVFDLTGKAFTPLHMIEDPLIRPGRDVQEDKAQPIGLPHNNPP